MWDQFDNGRSIGRNGSENGIIVLDEEHSDGARITLEQGGMTSPWAITCGIYGFLVHTVFISDETESREKYNAMKLDLVQVMQEHSDEVRHQKILDFVNKY